MAKQRKVVLTFKGLRKLPRGILSNKIYALLNSTASTHDYSTWWDQNDITSSAESYVLDNMNS